MLISKQLRSLLKITYKRYQQENEGNLQFSILFLTHDHKIR
jgi:hypothetical protein